VESGFGRASAPPPATAVEAVEDDWGATAEAADDEGRIDVADFEE